MYVFQEKQYQNHIIIHDQLLNSLSPHQLPRKFSFLCSSHHNHHHGLSYGTKTSADLRYCPGGGRPAALLPGGTSKPSVFHSIHSSVIISATSWHAYTAVSQQHGQNPQNKDACKRFHHLLSC